MGGRKTRKTDVHTHTNHCGFTFVVYTFSCAGDDQTDVYVTTRECASLLLRCYFCCFGARLLRCTTVSRARCSSRIAETCKDVVYSRSPSFRVPIYFFSSRVRGTSRRLRVAVRSVRHTHTHKDLDTSPQCSVARSLGQPGRTRICCSGMHTSYSSTLTCVHVPYHLNYSRHSESSFYISLSCRKLSSAPIPGKMANIWIYVVAAESPGQVAKSSASRR